MQQLIEEQKSALLAPVSQTDTFWYLCLYLYLSQYLYMYLLLLQVHCLHKPARRALTGAPHFCNSPARQGNPDQTQCARKMQTSTLKIAPHTIDSRHSIERVPIKTVSDKRLVCTDKLQLDAVQGGLIWIMLCTNLQIGDICVI